MTDALAHSTLPSSPGEAIDAGVVGRLLSEMTPEMLEDIYYAAYRAEAAKGMGVSAVVQREVRMAGWRAVLDAMQGASDLEWARRYLAMRECEMVGR